MAAKTVVNSLKKKSKPKMPKANASAATWDKALKKLKAYEVGEKARLAEKKRRESIRELSRKL